MPTDPSIPVPEVLAVIRDHVKDPETVKAVAADIAKIQREIAQEKEAEKEGKGPKSKNRFVVLIRSDNPAAQSVAAAGAYVVTVPDDDTTDTYNGTALLERIKKAVAYHNEKPAGKRGRKRSIIKKFTEAMANLKSKVFKETESKVLVKTKLPVEVVIVDKEEIV